MLSNTIVQTTIRRLLGRRTLSTAEGVIHKRGELPYGAREYLLLPPHIALSDVSDHLILARVHAHRHILFGARCLRGDLIEQCSSLVEAALEDASIQGEQPQAIGTLHGLSTWVRKCLDGYEQSEVLSTLEPLVVEACRAIATGIPRAGHSVVGVGTYRDAEPGWKALAKEYAPQSEECQLYVHHGGQLVGIEHLADRKEDYLRSAGGAMARFFMV